MRKSEKYRNPIDRDSASCLDSCETVERWIGTSVDLPTGTPAWVRRHVASCPDCRRECESAATSVLERLRTAEVDRGEVAVDRLFTRRVMAAVRAEPVPIVRQRRRFRQRASAALIVGGLIVAIAVLQGNGDGGASRHSRPDGPDGGSDQVSSVAREVSPDRAEGSARPMMHDVDPPLAAGFIPVVESDGTKFSL